MSYHDIIEQDLRLTILMILAQDADYAVNDAVLHRALEQVGHRISRDRMQTELAWLAEQGLLEAEGTGVGELAVIKLTARGMDVSQGRTVAPGVRRPGPGELG